LSEAKLKGLVDERTHHPIHPQTPSKQVKVRLKACLKERPPLRTPTPEGHEAERQAKGDIGAPFTYHADEVRGEVEAREVMCAHIKLLCAEMFALVYVFVFALTR
jgi:hypothetical protein